MGANTKIQWANHTFNLAEGCQKVSPACTNCYAERRDQQYHGGAHWGPNTTRKMMSESYWREPLRWNREAAKGCFFCGEPAPCECGNNPRPRVFSSSLADVFEDHPDLLKPRLRLFDLIRRTPHLDWLLLTKRPENILRLTIASGRSVEGDDDSFDDTLIWLSNFTTGMPLPNVWFGTTVETQEYASKRIPALLKIPATVRFLSVEPMLGGIDLTPYLPRFTNGVSFSLNEAPLIDWVIAGGESGRGARPTHPDWFRSLRDQCNTAGSPFHFKQHGEWIGVDQLEALMQPGETYGDKGWSNPAEHVFPDGTITVRLGKHITGRRLDGRTWDELPEV